MKKEDVKDLLGNVPEVGDEVIAMTQYKVCPYLRKGIITAVVERPKTVKVSIKFDGDEWEYDYVLPSNPRFVVTKKKNEKKYNEINEHEQN